MNRFVSSVDTTQWVSRAYDDPEFEVDEAGLAADAVSFAVVEGPAKIPDEGCSVVLVACSRCADAWCKAVVSAQGEEGSGSFSASERPAVVAEVFVNGEAHPQSRVLHCKTIPGVLFVVSADGVGGFGKGDHDRYRDLPDGQAMSWWRTLWGALRPRESKGPIPTVVLIANLNPRDLRGPLPIEGYPAFRKLFTGAAQPLASKILAPSLDVPNFLTGLAAAVLTMAEVSSHPAIALMAVDHLMETSVDVLLGITELLHPILPAFVDLSTESWQNIAAGMRARHLSSMFA